MRTIVLGLSLITSMAAATLDIYVGTRTSLGKSKGIYKLSFDTSNGALGPAELAAETIDPSFIVLHPTRKLLYGVNAQPEGKLSAFAIEANGNLRLLNQVSSKGAGPAHVQIDRSGNWVTAANYTSGSVSVHRIGSDGRLSEAVDWKQHEGKSVHPTWQSGPHAHSTYFSADNKTLYAADLGLDQVKVYAFDAATGKLTEGKPLEAVKGGGPRHVDFGKKRTYVLNEISSSVSVFAGGQLVETVSALPEGFSGASTAAEVVLDAKEKFLYSSNRGANTIAVFAVGDKLRKIADVAVGKVPRNFVLSPDGRFLLAAAQDEDFVQVFRVDPKTGLLEKLGKEAAVPTPICLRFAKK